MPLVSLVVEYYGKEQWKILKPSARTRTSTRLNLTFLRVFSKKDTPQSFILLFSPKKVIQSFILKEI